MFKQAFENELKFEGASTRKLLERVPFENPKWHPHAKSRDIDALAKHVANIYNWIPLIISKDDVDFSKGSMFPPFPEMKSNEDLLKFYDETLENASKALENTTDEELTKTFSMKNGEHVVRSFPKAAAIRNLSFNHLVHHRGQLGVYLRLLDIPIPGMYGPSADEQRG